MERDRDRDVHFMSRYHERNHGLDMVTLHNFKSSEFHNNWTN